MKLFTEKRYICEIHRDLYDWINMQPDIVDKERGIALIDEAFNAGKRMSAWMKKKDQLVWKRAMIIDYPWGKTWLPLYINSFQNHGYKVSLWDGKTPLPTDLKVPDVVLCTWADRDFTERFPESRHVLMMRRFEFFHAPYVTWNWDKISALICCNPWIAKEVAEVIDPQKVHYLPNPIDAKLWTIKQREHGKRIGMVCSIKDGKNIALAAQIILALPSGYELHVAGGEEDNGTTRAYVESVLWGKRVNWCGKIKNKNLDEWWEDKNYCLSTSLSEGDPMNVLEACAKGVKPIIHAWPGAKEMYPPDWVFDSVEQARDMILRGEYKSDEYRKFVERSRTIVLADKVVDIVTLADGDSSNPSASQGAGFPSQPRPLYLAGATS